jgi:hypothetical protein
LNEGHGHHYKCQFFQSLNHCILGVIDCVIFCLETLKLFFQQCV